jgi:hypothetical protein
VARKNTAEEQRLYVKCVTLQHHAEELYKHLRARIGDMSEPELDRHLAKLHRGDLTLGDLEKEVTMTRLLNIDDFRTNAMAMQGWLTKQGCLAKLATKIIVLPPGKQKALETMQLILQYDHDPSPWVSPDRENDLYITLIYLADFIEDALQWAQASSRSK